MKKKGPLRESNSGPPAPEAGIMPLDQVDNLLLQMRLRFAYNFSARRILDREKSSVDAMFHKV